MAPKKIGKNRAVTANVVPRPVTAIVSPRHVTAIVAPKEDDKAIEYIEEVKTVIEEFEEKAKTNYADIQKL